MLEKDILKNASLQLDILLTDVVKFLEAVPVELLMHRQKKTISGYSGDGLHQWVFAASNLTDVLNIKFHSIDITDGDYVDIRDGNSSVSRRIGIFNGTEIPRSFHYKFQLCLDFIQK